METRYNIIQLGNDFEDETYNAVRAYVFRFLALGIWRVSLGARAYHPYEETKCLPLPPSQVDGGGRPCHGCGRVFFVGGGSRF